MGTTLPDGDSDGVGLLDAVSCFNGSIRVSFAGRLLRGLPRAGGQTLPRQPAGAGATNFLCQRPFHNPHNLLADIFQSGRVDVDPVELARCLG